MDLFLVWLFELGDASTIQFGPDAYTTKDLMNQEGVNIARDKALNTLNDVKNPWKYGQKEFYESTSATLFLGSYIVNISVSHLSARDVLLSFDIQNTSGWASGTRLRKDNDHNGQHDPIIPDKERREGIRLGGNLTQRWRWTEIHPKK